MARKPWSMISQQLSPEQVAAVEAKVAKMDRAATKAKTRAEAAADGASGTVVSRTRRPRVVGLGLPVTARDVAEWILREDGLQPGFAAAVDAALADLRRARRRKRA